MLFFRSKIRTAILRDVYLVICINNAYGSTYYGINGDRLEYFVRINGDLMSSGKISLSVIFVR